MFCSYSLVDSSFISSCIRAVLQVWDLRLINMSKVPVARFKHHTAPITSVQWCPHESTVFAAAGEDDQVTLWDLSVERDQDLEKTDE